MKIGQGFDVHKFGQMHTQQGTLHDGMITLAGVKVPCSLPLLAHSDGDVALHALCDAILGALALGDIGEHFKDTDPAHAGLNSREIGRYTLDLMRQKGYKISNLDLTFITQIPKITPYKQDMAAALADIFDVPVNAIGIKATTCEGLGFLGRCEGIAAQAVVLLIEETASACKTR